MRSLATLATLAALAAGARADRADPLAGAAGPAVDRPAHWLYELVLMCGPSAMTPPPWCEPPAAAAPRQPPQPQPPPPPPKPPGTAVIASKVALDPSNLTANQVAAKIASAYLGGVLRCYRDALAKRPALRGTLKVAFQVNAVGKLDELAVTGVDEVSGCVSKQAAAWRFPIPQSTYSEPRTARFTIGIALAP